MSPDCQEDGIHHDPKAETFQLPSSALYENPFADVGRSSHRTLSKSGFHQGADAFGRGC